jgi:DNA-binding LytR/AlgR family response regulator
MSTLKVLITDDEPFARKGLKEYIEEIDFLELAGEADSPLKADAILKSQPVDLLLCDIQMPRMNGIEFIKMLKQPPMVVFTTAYPEYALQSYELDVLDYLLKPIGFERFYKAMQKALEFHTLRQAARGTASGPATPVAIHAGNDYCFIKSDNQLEKVWLKDILFIEALQNYVAIHVATGPKRLAYLTLGNMEAALPPDAFIKIHKSYIVNLLHVDRLAGDDLWIGTHQLPISRTLKEVVLEKIVNSKLIKR